MSPTATLISQPTTTLGRNRLADFGSSGSGSSILTPSFATPNWYQFHHQNTEQYQVKKDCAFLCVKIDENIFSGQFIFTKLESIFKSVIFL